MSREKLPAGCAIPILIIAGLIIYFSTKESPEEAQKRKEEHNTYLKKYDYNPDTLASNLTYSHAETSDGRPQLKGKVLVLYVYKDNISFNPRPTEQLPDDWVAYKRADLHTIVLVSHSKERISEWGAHGVYREQADLRFIDFNTRQLIYSTTILGSHYFESKSRRGSTSHYNLYESDIASEIIRIVNNSNY